MTPDKPDYMIAVFFLVIIGLSLVSMSAHVIQHRIEQLYVQLLMRLLEEYQRRLAENPDKTGATLGIMEAWQTNARSRFLLPLLR